MAGQQPQETPEQYFARMRAQYNQTSPNPAPLSKVEQFSKQQTIDDGTKVGGVEQAVLPKIQAAIEAGKKKPVLGAILNPAMTLMENINKDFVQPAQHAVSTVLLTQQSIGKKKNFVEDFKYAKEQSKKISMGQALATSLGKAVGELTPDSITPDFMDSNFDVFNDTQRKKAFRDEWSGIVASGITDLSINWLGSKGAGKAVKTIAKASLGSTTIKSAAQMEQFANLAEQAVSDAANGVKPTSGLGVLINDAVSQRDINKLTSNPLVSESSNPYRNAIILSRLDNHRDVADFLLAERGDAGAFNRLMQSKPFEADALSNYGKDAIDPKVDFSKITYENITPELTQRYKTLIDAKRKSDPTFATEMDDFFNKVSEAKVVETFQPTRFGLVETARLGSKQISQSAKIGDLKLFGDDANSSWKTAVYQSTPYDRAIRLIAYIGSGRPQGYINISNPRRFEAKEDLLSDLNRLQMLRGADGAKFKQSMVNRFLEATDDTQRAVALGWIERQVMERMAKYYGVINAADVNTVGDAVKKINAWHFNTSARRQSTMKYAQDHGLIPDDDGNINVTNFIAQANEAQSLPMLDFRRLETEVIFNTRKELGGMAPITGGQVASAVTSRALTGISHLLDTANMVFNTLNLVRLAYIPKNSMVDPMMRGMMATSSLQLMRNAYPGMSNVMYNASLNAERIGRWVPGTTGNKSRRLAKSASKEIDAIYPDLEKSISRSEYISTNIGKASKDYNNLIARRDKLAAKKKKTVDEQTALNEMNAQLDNLKSSIDSDSQQLDSLKSRIAAMSTKIELNRAKLREHVKRGGELKQRKHLGQETETITSENGNVYTIQGLADPNVRGANAYMSELDPTQNFYSASMQSEYLRTLKSEGNRFVKISRYEKGGKPYFNALQHIANRQIRNEIDMPLGMIFGGADDLTVFNWLKKSEAGKEYVARLGSRYSITDPKTGKITPHILSDEELIGWIQSTRDRVLKMYPDEQLRQTILQRPVTYQEIEAALKGRTDLLKEIDGPNVRLSDLNPLERAGAIASAGIDAAWRALSASETRMVRNPMFMLYAREEMQKLVNAAERAGLNPTDGIVNHQYRQIAYRNALKRVEQTLYSSRRLTNGMYAMRYAMSFPMAFFNSQMVAVRLMAQNPMNAYWYDSVIKAFDNRGVYEDQQGNTYDSIDKVPKGTSVSVQMKFPFWDNKNIPDFLKPYADQRGGGIRLNPKQLEFMVADPSISWMGGIGLSQVIKTGFGVSLWNKHGEDVVKYLRDNLGNDFYESSLLYGGYPQGGDSFTGTVIGSILPSYIETLYGYFAKDKQDRFFDETNVQFRVAMEEWQKNGRVGKIPTWESAAKAAGNLAFIKAFTQWALPISASYDPVTRSAMKYYATLLKENSGDFAKADAQFTKDWGVESLALLGSSKSNTAGLASNMSDIKIVRNNKDLLIQLAEYNPKYAGMLSTGYGELTDQYSPEIASIYKNLEYPGGGVGKLSQRKESIDIRKEIETRPGYYQYNLAVQWRDAFMQQYAVRNTSDVRYERLGIKEQFDNKVKAIKEKYPIWAATRDQDRKDFWNATFPAIQSIINNKAWMDYSSKSSKVTGGVDKWAEIANWVNVVSEYKKEIDRPRNSKQRDKDLKTSLAQFHYDYIQSASDEFEAFASRWLENMPELNPELAVQ